MCVVELLGWSREGQGSSNVAHELNRNQYFSAGVKYGAHGVTGTQSQSPFGICAM